MQLDVKKTTNKNKNQKLPMASISVSTGRYEKSLHTLKNTMQYSGLSFSTMRCIKAGLGKLLKRLYNVFPADSFGSSAL